MKKFCTLLLLAAATCGAASAQNFQPANADFNAAWVDCIPWTSDGNTNKANKQPSGWKVSNIYQKVSVVSVKTELAEQVQGQTGAGNDYAVKLKNYNLSGRNVPGYIALGTPWATASTKMWNVQAGSTDGGAWGGKDFTGHPDAIAFAYKRDNSKGAESASVIAYTWRGTWTQTNVPGNTAVGLASYGTPKKTTITNRDVCILGYYDAKKHLGDAPTHTADAQLVAKLEHYITNAASDWTEVIVPFDYGTLENPGQQKVENINIVFSATDYFAGEGAVVAENTFTIDNVKLLYYSELASAVYDGATVSFSGTSATVDAVYNASKLSLTSNGKGATIETSYNEDTYQLTVTVKGEDISENSTNKHVYTIQFAKPKATATMSLSAAAGWGTFCAPFEVTVPAGTTAYSVTEVSETGVLTTSRLLPTPPSRFVTIPANTPVVLSATKDVNANFEGAPVNGTPVAGLLTGVYEATTVPAGSYVLQNQSRGVGFYLVDDVLPTVQPNRCYLTLPAGSNCRALFFEEDLVTALDNAIIVDEPEAAYDLQGRRVSVAGQKGMFIIGGRKVIK